MGARSALGKPSARKMKAGTTRSHLMHTTSSFFFSIKSLAPYSAPPYLSCPGSRRRHASRRRRPDGTEARPARRGPEATSEHHQQRTSLKPDASHVRDSYPAHARFTQRFDHARQPPRAQHRLHASREALAQPAKPKARKLRQPAITPCPLTHSMLTGDLHTMPAGGVDRSLLLPGGVDRSLLLLLCPVRQRCASWAAHIRCQATPSRRVVYDS